MTHAEAPEGTTTTPMTEAIRVQELSFTYRDAEYPSLENINLNVRKGEFVTVMGPSGAGKSTLSQALNGLVPHQIRGGMEGGVHIYDKSVNDSTVAAMAEYIGLVFQDFEAQLFSTNVELEVAFSAENLGIPRDEMKRRVAGCLARVKLAGFESRQPATLSGGQKQRLAIASVLAASPDVMCLDEPTTDLDPVGKTEVFTIANALTEAGITLVVVEHETPEALMSSRIVLMDEGRIVRDGPAREVLQEVEAFHKLRIMPLQVPDLFAYLGYPVKERPLTIEQASAEYATGRVSFHADSHDRLAAADLERHQGYGDTVIDAKNVVHRYPTGLTAVDDVSLSIRAGEFIAILGQNGSGKTTFVKHLNGLLKPTSGSVMVGELDTQKTNLRALGDHVGYVFQNPDHQIFSDTVFDEVAFALKKRGMPKEEIKTRVTEVLSAVGLGGQEEGDPFSLTKGQRQRVAVASALALHPDVLILDEPTTGLDYSQQQSMMNLVKDLNAKGSTIIIVTHAMWVVCEYAHRTVVMKDGRIVADDTTRNVFGQEEALEGMALQPPPVVALSNALGSTALSVAEMREMTKGAKQ